MPRAKSTETKEGRRTSKKRSAAPGVRGYNPKPKRARGAAAAAASGSTAARGDAGVSSARSAGAKAALDAAAQTQLAGLAAAILAPLTVEKLALFLEAANTHGTTRALLSARSLPRDLLALVATRPRSASLCDAVSRVLVLIACAPGDSEAARRARAWGAHALAVTARGMGTHAHGSVSGHAEQTAIGLAPRNTLDAASVRVMVSRGARALSFGSPKVDELRALSTKIADIVDAKDVQPLVNALCIAAVRVPASLDDDDSVLCPAFIQAAMKSTLSTEACAALIVMDETARSTLVRQAVEALTSRLFVRLDVECKLADGVGWAAAQDVHLYWDLLRSAVEEADYQRAGTWRGRQAHRALLASAARHVSGDGNLVSIPARLPRAIRGQATSLLVLGEAAIVARSAGSNAMEIIGGLLQQGDDGRAVLVACEHAVDVAMIAAVATNTAGESNVPGFRALYTAGRVAGGQRLGDSEAGRIAKDASFASDLLRAFVIACQTEWAHKPSLTAAARKMLDLYEDIHGREEQVKQDFVEAKQAWFTAV